jgi:hypothetical protein
MTFSRWHVFIGLSQTSVFMFDTHPYRSDGQKRSVYIYRFLTTGTIDGEFIVFGGDET